MSRARRIGQAVALVLAAGALVLCAGVVNTLYQLFHHDEMVPELADRPVPEVVRVSKATGAFQVEGVVIDPLDQPAVRTVRAVDPYTDAVLDWATSDAQTGLFQLELDRPAILRVEQPVDGAPLEVTGAVRDVVFIVPESCPITVRVEDTEGAGVPGALVRAQVFPEGWLPQVQSAVTDDDGVAALPEMVCSEVGTVGALHSTGTIRESLDTLQQQEVVLVVGHVDVTLTIVDDAGQPVASGQVRMQDGEEGVPFVDGTFQIGMPPLDTSIALEVHGDRVGVVGYRHQYATLYGPEVTVVLPRYHALDVYCAGMPDDRCTGVAPIRCDSGLAPGDLCGTDASGDTFCQCPLEQPVVRTAEDEVAVMPDDEAIWLDYRGLGTITGTLVNCPRLGGCEVVGLQWSFGRNGLPPARVAELDADGRFTLAGLEPGTWGVVIGGHNGMRELPDVEIDGNETVDVGVIDMAAEGSISGEVFDGLTGEVADNELVGLRTVGRPSRVNPFGSMTESDDDGVFVFEGLEDGEYEVYLVRRPFTRQVVSVNGGAVTGVELETAEGGLLEDQGFGVDDDLVVTDLNPDGWAAESDLQRGDRIVGVTIFGVDSTAFDWEISEGVARMALEHYAGSVDLIVERDGELVEVQLD